MSWTKLDDGFWMHPKVIRAGNEAVGVFARCLSYCGAYLTDGLVPAEVALTIAGSQDKLDAVASTGLLDKLPTGNYAIRDYAHYNPLRDEVEAKRQQRREAGRRGGLARGRNA